jgi:hypothetical protein
MEWSKVWGGTVALASVTCAMAMVPTEAHARVDGVRHKTTDDAVPAPEHAATPSLKAWLQARAPAGAEVTGEGNAVAMTYTTRKDDTLASVAHALLPFSRIYLWEDFAEAIAKRNPALHAGIKEGMRLAIPDLIDAPYKTGPDARLPSPSADTALRGLYVRGDRGGSRAFPAMLDKMAERGINAIVLDTKDTDGKLTYASKVPLAIETEATKGAPIADLQRTIRFAHARGVRVIMRVSCFHDEWMQHHKGKEMSIKGKWGGVYPIGWLDPANATAQGYLIDLAKEAIEAGADEVELDYVRYPVIGIKNADFHLDAIKKTKPEVIRDFVHDVHAVTRAHHVPLSLDIFGVVAQGKRVDIDGLGQDIALLGPECEVLSPMVYPSHYAKGFMGFEVPGNHPELVGIGTKGTLGQLELGNVTTGTRVRPWVQAMNFESPDYSPGYLARELRSATENGSSGWLMWNPQQDYSYAWQAVPKLRDEKPVTAPSAPARRSSDRQPGAPEAPPPQHRGAKSAPSSSTRP